jgi:hypothetical protein
VRIDARKPPFRKENTGAKQQAGLPSKATPGLTYIKRHTLSGAICIAKKEIKIRLQ